MNPLRALGRALARRIRAPQAARLESLAAANRASRGDLRELQRELAAIGNQMTGLQRDIEQLATLRADEAAAALRLDRLAPALDWPRAAAYVHDAVGRSAVVDVPAPHAIIAEIFPPDLYRELIGTIPPDAFFRTDPDGGRELMLPPRLAPLDAIAAWTFVTGLVEQALVPALAARFERFVAGRDLVSSRLRLVRGRPSSLKATRSPGVLTLLAGLDRAGPQGNVGVVFSPGAEAAGDTWLAETAAGEPFTLKAWLEVR